MILKRVMTVAATALFAATSFSLITANSANADSCWTHNGSIMRLQAQGQKRWFSYEKPRAGLAVSKGTVLFNGTNKSGWYSGTANVFSKFCPGNPLGYYVEGPVSNNQTRVTMRGTREVHNKCQATGRVQQDVLVFNYSHQC